MILCFVFLKLYHKSLNQILLYPICWMYICRTLEVYMPRAGCILPVYWIYTSSKPDVICLRKGLVTPFV